jgi:tripartite ATP-independent transporter DctM subunit
MVTGISKDISEREPALAIWLSKIGNSMDKIGLFSRWVNAVGLGIFFIMMCFTVFDVFMRYILNNPVLGSKEVTEVMLILLVSFTIAYTYNEKSHVQIDLVTTRLKPKARLVLETITNLFGLGIFAILVWQSIAQVFFLFKTGTVHGTVVMIPAAPFEAMIALGCTLLFLLLLRDFFKNMAEGLKLHIRVYEWVLIFGVPIAILIFAQFWMQPKLWVIGLPLLGLIGIIVSLALMFTGLPTSFSLIMASILFIGHIRGTATAFDVVSTEVFSTAANYLWSTIAFFVLMGYFCLYARFGEDIYVTAHRWLGHLQGGLAIATIGASTALAGIVGDSLSVTTTMGSVALPQMRKYRYSDLLSTGAIAAGSTIGPLIPPSMGFIIYGVLTGMSIGQLFVAGIIPGLILAMAFIAVIVIRCRLNPKLGPRGDKSTWKERGASLKAGGPIVLLFLLVIGGIYAGAFTATEGGAIGCFGAFAIAMAMRRYSRQSFIGALVGAGKIIGMIFLILVGAMMFTRFIAWCNMADVTTAFMSSLHLDPKVTVALILIIFFALGFFVDIMPLMLIGIPIFHPVAMAAGVDPIWFAVMFVMTIQVGVITPPFAVILFAIKGMAKDIPISVIFRGVLPFVVGTITVIILIFFIPPLANWLPGLLYK